MCIDANPPVSTGSLPIFTINMAYDVLKTLSFMTFVLSVMYLCNEVWSSMVMWMFLAFLQLPALQLHCD